MDDFKLSKDNNNTEGTGYSGYDGNTDNTSFNPSEHSSNTSGSDNGGFTEGAGFNYSSGFGYSSDSDYGSTGYSSDSDYSSSSGYSSGYSSNNGYSEYSDMNSDPGSGTYQEQGKKKKRRKKDHTPANPIFLTRKKLAVIFVLVIALAFGGAFGGMAAYNVYHGGSTKSKGSINGDGYTLAGATGSAKTVDEISNENKDSVVEITTESVTSNDAWLGQYVSEGAGSGVIIKEDGYIITNNHVVEGASKIHVTLHNSKQYEATLIGTDPETDIAVIKIDASGLTPATYGNSDELEVGDMSVIIGNPLGELGGTVTAGIISALDREITIDGQPMTLLQTDASVNPGNSGGGMFDQYGHLVGIVVAKSSGSDVEGLGFAIPINTAADIASQLMENGKVESTTGYSGMTYTQDQNGRIYIQQVNETFAQEAGFQAGDQVLSIDGTVVNDLNEVSAAIKKHNKGDTVTFTVIRNNKQLDIDITLQSK